MPTQTRTDQIQSDDPSPETRVLRHLSDMIRLHGLCTQAACRRVRGCRGEPRDCLSRYAPLVPEAAREGAKAILDGRRQGLDFDELDDEDREDIMALVEWDKAITRSYERPQGRRK